MFVCQQCHSFLHAKFDKDGRHIIIMSNTKHRGHVVFLGATNRPDLMDAALRRPGRFDKKIPFLVPDENGRIAIIKVMAKKYELGSINPNKK